MAATPATGNLSMELDPKYDNYDYPTTSPHPQPGHPGHLTEKEQKAVIELRARLEKIGEPVAAEEANGTASGSGTDSNTNTSAGPNDDGYQMFREDHSYRQRLDSLTLLRFLRARKFDVNLSFKMFIDCEKWRKQVDLDNILPEWTYPEKEKLNEYYPQYYHKTDKDGRPVYIEQLGKIDLEKMYQITTSERMLMNLAVEYERVADPRLPACSRKAGALLETCCTIMDLKGVGLNKARQVYTYLKLASDLSQNNYPERLGRLYIINAPWGFSAIWSAIKGWLDPVTANKIKLCGSDYQKELLAQVPIYNLPKQFGGHCECPGGCENSDMGPWREKEWARPAWWEKKGGAASAASAAGATNSTTIDGAPSEVKNVQGVADTSAAVPTATADAPAPAPALA